MKTNKSEYLKECMADSLILLLKTKKIEKISVSEITERAGVGRATWFRHFSSKNEALTYKLIKSWYDWTDSNGIDRGIKYTSEIAFMFFDFSYNIRAIYNLIYESNLQSVIYDAFYQIIIPQHKDDPIACYKSRFISHGLFGLLDEWIKREYKETPEEMARLFHSTLGEFHIT